MARFEVVRTTTIAAEPSRVHSLIEDFREWRRWSPWEDLDPDLRREYSGAGSGVGARYAWEGNRKAGKGNMEITESTPDRVGITLTFLKPFSATNDVALELTRAGGATDVTWRMSGERRGIWGLVGRLIPMDRMVGKDFEKGLARLKETAEQP